MNFTTSPATAHAPSASSLNALAPLRLPLDLRLTPEQFDLVCAENREAVLELDADGQQIWMSTVGGETSLQNAVLSFQLTQFAHHTGDWISFASCTGSPSPIVPR